MTRPDPAILATGQHPTDQCSGRPEDSGRSGTVQQEASHTETAESAALLAAVLLASPCPTSLVQCVLAAGADASGRRHVVDGQAVWTFDQDRPVHRHQHPGTVSRYDQLSDLLDLAAGSVVDGTVVDGTVAGRSVRQPAVIADVLKSAPTVRPAGRAAGQVLLAVGLALVFRPSWVDLGVAALLALPTAVLILGLRATRFQTIAPVVVAFAVSVPVLLFAANGWLDQPRKVLIALLASEIPGAGLTLGALDLAQKQVSQGVTRLAAGVQQLILLALGIYLAGQATGKSLDSVLGTADNMIPAWSAGAGVVVYVVGVALAFSARMRSLPPLVVTGLVAWSTLQLTHQVMGGFAAAFAAATAATLTAVVLYRLVHRLNPILSFNPVFRLVAPGGLALLGVTAPLGGPVIDVGAVVFTFVSVALGIVVTITAASAAFQPTSEPVAKE